MTRESLSVRTKQQIGGREIPAFANGPLAMISSFWRNRELLGRLTWRDVSARYRGSLAGFFWAIANPLFMLAVYTFAFGFIFQTDRSHLTPASVTKAAFDIFAGLIVFNLFSESINRAPQLILNNVNFVKKVVFPLDILGTMVVGAAAFNAFMSLLALSALFVIARSAIHLTVLLSPLILLPLMLFTLGATWFLAALGVYVRDVGQTVANVTMATMFLSPIFYDISALPPWLLPYVYLNPLTLPVEQLRAAVLYGRAPNWPHLLVYSLSGFLAAWLGFYCFERSRKGFADVI